jgi:hypothetical protein
MRRGFGLTIEREQKAEQHLDSRADNEEKSTASVCLHLTRGAASQKPASESNKASEASDPTIACQVQRSLDDLRRELDARPRLLLWIRSQPVEHKCVCKLIRLVLNSLAQ